MIGLSASAADIALSKEILYFRPQADNLEYAVIQEIGDGTAPVLKVCNTRFAPSLGNRLKMSFILPTDWWISLGYTTIEFDCTASKKHSNNDIINYLAIDSRSFKNGIAKQVKSHWLIDYQNLDLKLGKTFDISKYISIGSSFAAKLHYFKNNYDTKYIDLNLDHNVNLDSRQFINSSTFLGAGIEIGFNGIFRVTPRWSLFYTVNSGMLKGNFYNKGKQLSNEIVECIFLNSRKAMVPIVSHSIGIQYSISKGDQVDLDFSLAYEANLFSNHLKMFNLFGFRTSNILMDGLVAKAQIGF